MYAIRSYYALSLVQQFENKYILFGPDLVHDSGMNPEFEQDTQLLADWRMHAEADGFRIKIGRWKVPGRPITVLIDFTNFITKKDEIFTEMRNNFV